MKKYIKSLCTPIFPPKGRMKGTKAGSDLDDIIEIIEDLENKGETKWIKLKFRKILEVR